MSALNTTEPCPPGLSAEARTLLIVRYLRVLRETRKKLARDVGHPAEEARYSQEAVAQAIGLGDRQFGRWESQGGDRPTEDDGNDGATIIRLKDEHFINLVVYLGASFDHVRSLRTSRELRGDGKTDAENLAKRQASVSVGEIHALSQFLPEPELVELTNLTIDHPELIPALLAQGRLIALHLRAPARGRRKRGSAVGRVIS